MNISCLEELVNKNDINQAIRVVEKIVERKDRSYNNVLIKIMHSTQNSVLRNSIAIALADIGADEAVESIINLLEDPKTKGSRGTLLYALESFDVKPYALNFVDLLDGNFEVSRHAFQLLSMIAEDLSQDIKEQCKLKITQKLLQAKKQEDQDFLHDALKLF